MLGHLEKSSFDPQKNYNEFYAGHKFQPIPEPQCYLADMVIPRVGWAVDVAGEIRAGHVLDLCCLDGFALLSMATRLDVAGTGVDLSADGIRLAQDRAMAKKLNLRFIEGRVEDFQDEVGYDLVLLFEAIEHFTNVEAVIDTIKRNMNPGATLLVSTPDAEGYYGIRNVEDTCHLQVYSHKPAADLPHYPADSPVKKPIISLPDYLVAQGFTIISNDVWDQLIHVRAVLN